MDRFDYRVRGNKRPKKSLRNKIAMVSSGKDFPRHSLKASTSLSRGTNRI